VSRLSQATALGRSLHEDKGGKHSQDSVASQGGPADGLGVELAEAVTVGGTALRHVEGDAGDEGQQQNQGAEGAVPGARRRQQGDRKRKLDQG
jgi:hypothetical protein